MMNIVLFNPEIPQNTGNIARTCAATGATLHLIEPLGFSLSDKYLKRAGLDYWNLMTYHTYPDFGEFLRQHPDARMHFASTKAPRGYHEATYQDGDFLIFGCETRGLPENLLEQVYDRCIRIPMRPEARSLNLSNSVAIVLYEALRQTDFPGLSSQGHLTGRDEEPAPWLDYVGLHPVYQIRPKSTSDTNSILKHGIEHSRFFVPAKLSEARRTGGTRERNEAKLGRKRCCANDMVSMRISMNSHQEIATHPIIERGIWMFLSR